MARTLVGLEITEEEVRAAEVTVGKTPKILSHGTVRLPTGAAKDSEVLDRTAVVAALQELWRKAGFKGRRVVLGLCSRRVLVRDYRTQAMPPELLKRALPFQVADLLPVPVDQAVVDFYGISQDGDDVTGLLVAAVADTVTELVETVSQAKLQVDQVDLAPFGLLRAITVLTESAETVAVVHLGPHTGYVVVAKQGVPHFVRIIPLELSKALLDPEAEHHDESAQPAVPPVTTPPATDSPDAMTKLFGAPAEEAASLSQERIDDMVTQVINTMRFHIDRSNSTIDRVFITGAGTGIPGVYHTFKNRLAVPVQRVGGHHLTQSDVRSRHGEEDLELLTPVGLAMMGAK